MTMNRKQSARDEAAIDARFARHAFTNGTDMIFHKIKLMPTENSNHNLQLHSKHHPWYSKIRLKKG